MVEDVVRALGYLCLGTRLKRIAEQLQAEAQGSLDRMEPQIPAGQHPFLAALDRCGPLSVGELAEAIGVAQPGVTRIIGNLVSVGLVEVRPSELDQRRRVVALTQAGQVFVDTAKTGMWRQVERHVARLCADLDGPLLDQLGKLEDNITARRSLIPGRNPGE